MAVGDERTLADLNTPHEIRDPIHGLIHLTDQELAIINTSLFQRLRRIRQLAMAYLVYPGALHTRFDHLLGTLHVAHRILTRLNSLPRTIDHVERVFYTDAVSIRLAALLHDVGHGPFSHVSEHLLERHYDRRKVGESPIRAQIHEKITVDIIGNASELKPLLTQEERDAVIRLIRGTGERDFRRDIVSSALDADKMDYLLRDAYYAGVEYGRYDLDKIIDACRIHRSGRESYLMLDESGLYALEQLVFSKHHMTQQVYAHRVRTIADVMIVRGLELAIAADRRIASLFTYDGSERHLSRYLKMDDETMIQAVLASKDHRAKKLFERLRDRKLFKELALIQIDERRVPDSVKRTQLSLLPEGDHPEIESRIAMELGCEPWEVFVHKRRLKNPAYQSPGVLDPEAVHVIMRDGTTRTLSQFDEVATPRLATQQSIHVIGPWDQQGEPSDRRKAREELESRITKLVFDAVGGER